MNTITNKVIDRLHSQYHFKQVGEWLRNGVCPDCGKKELYTHATNPRVVKCARLNKCGSEYHIKDLFDDLFTDWSNQYKQTENNPNAAADAYLREGRCLNIKKLKNTYSQDSFFCRKTKKTSATVRFTLPDGGWWERLIDRPDQFERKAHIKYGYKVNGHMWLHPDCKITGEELWIAEGIFDACALAEHGINAASCISCTNFPRKALTEIQTSCKKAGKPFPILVWAFDNDSAGKAGTFKCIKLAEEMGFECKAAQPPHSKQSSKDWSDLHENGKLTDDDIANYRYYGELLTAKRAADAGLLIYNHHDGTRRSFSFEHRQRTYWFEYDINKFTKEMQSIESECEDTGEVLTKEEMRERAIKNSNTVTEICNAALSALYFQRNEVTDESWYYMRVATQKGSISTTVTGDQLSSPGKFKPRLLSVFPGVFWTGSAAQLDIIMRNETEGLKEVKTVDFIGYSAEHKAYIFNDVAFNRGRAIKINAQDYFKLGRMELKSLARSPHIEINTKDAPNFTWWNDFYTVRGSYGVIALAWWFGSYFAEQIRSIDKSYPFIEIVGQAGAGKSRMLEFFWRLSGRDDYEGFDPAKATAVARYRAFAQVANMPVTLIEGDRNDQDGKNSKQSFDWDELKDAFNGRSIRSRGVKNNANDTYEPPFRAAIAISQNETIQASEAMLTRIIHMELTRKGQTLETKRMVDELDRIPVEQTSVFLATALKKEKDIIESYTQKVHHYEQTFHEKGITHTRIALNHAQICALIDCLQEHVLTGQLTDPQVREAKNTLFIMARNRVERLSADHSQVQEFWSVYEYLEHMQNAGVNHHADDMPTVAININDFYRIAFEQRQNLPDKVDMKRLLKTSKAYKFIDSNRQVATKSKDRHITKNWKCWIFEKPKHLQK